VPPPIPTPVDDAARPLRRDAERNRQRILRAAREVFADRGLTASLDDIARHAEVGVGTVYRRFPDKQLLIDALFEERVAEVVAAFEEGLANPDPWDGLATTLETVLEWQARDQGLKELLLVGSSACAGIDGARRRIAPLGEQLLRRAQADGSVRPDAAPSDIPLLQIALGSLMAATRDLEPELWRRFLGIVLDGLRASRDGPTPLPVTGLESERVPEAMSACRSRR
jgi:AcrR family transcriptional regulator